jgi:hypothetical protein
MPENHAAEIRTLSQYLQAHSESIVFARLADRYLRMNEIDRAIDICLRGIGNHPNYAGAHFVLAKCHLAKRQYDEVEKCLKRVCKLEPAFLPAHRMYGELMANLGQKKAQNDRYRLILRIDPLAPVQVVEEPEPAPVKPPAPAEPVVSAAAPLLDWPIPMRMEPPAPVEPMTMPELTTPTRPSPQPETPLQAVLHMPEEADMNLSFDASTFYEPTPEAEPLPVREPARNLEIELMPDVEEPEETPAANDFEREEMRFSLMLDDLFSPNLEEEQKLEQETRTTLARAAQEEPVFKHPPLEPQESPSPVVKRPEVPVDRMATARTMPPRQPAPTAPPRMETPRPRAQAPVSTPRPASPQPPPPQPLREAPQIRVKKTQPPPQPPPPRPKARPLEEEKKSPLPEFGPDFSKYPESAGEDDLNAFIDHLDRMAARDMEPLAQSAEASQEPVSFSPFESAAETGAAEEDEESNAEKTKDKFVTPTLGEIYAAQGQYAKAVNVFEMLLKKNPENEWYRTKLDYLRKRQAEEKN